MKLIRTTACGLGIVLLAAVPASYSHSAPTTAIDQEVLTAREAAWRAYFAGDVKTLGDLLPEEFIGISMDDTPFADRARDARWRAGVS